MMKVRCSSWFGILAVAGALAIAAPGIARASTESDLATAENAYAALDYAPAASAAELVLAHAGLNHDLLTRATRVAALSSAALGRGDAARQYFTQLLEYDPNFRVDARLGPRFAEPFAEARGFWQAQGVKPGLTTQAAVAYGQPGRIQYETKDPLNIVKKVSVAYRWAPAHDYVVTGGTPGRGSVDTEPNPQGSLHFEYYVRALDGNDRAIFEEGAAEAPKSATVEVPNAPAVTEEKKSIFASPIFWVATGVVVVAAAVGGYFAFRPTDYQSTGHARGTITTLCNNMPCD